MTILSKAVQVGGLAVVIGVLSALPASSQQTPPATGAQMQPAPGMGDQMRQQGMERGRKGQGMGMERQGTAGPTMQMQGQMPGGMAGTAGPNMGPQMMQTMPMTMQGHMIDLPADHIEGRIAYLHAELKITDAQMPAWTEFANVLRANAKRIEEAQKAQAQRTTTTAADRLDDQERWLTARLENVKALKPTFTKLYAALDDSQKKIGDELFGPHMPRMGMQ